MGTARKNLIILIIAVTLIGTVPAHARIGADKFKHAGAGFAIALVTNIVLQKWTRPEYTVLGIEHSPFITRTDGKELGPLERAIFSALVAGIGGAVYEYVNRRESVADPNDAIATLLGGVGAGLFTITIGF